MVTDRYHRYLLVHKDTKSVDYTAPTIGELFEVLRMARSDERVGRSGTYTYYVNRHEIVDCFEEPGRIVYALQNPPRLPRWEPEVEDDIRF